MITQCRTGLDLVALVTGKANQAQRRGPLLVAVTGYPYVGKTTFCHRLVASWRPGRAVTVPTEAVVLPRQLRRERGVDGCSDDGHDVRGLLRLVDELRAGRSVAVDDYSWQSGRHEATVQLPGVGEDGLIIVDGSVAASPAAVAHFDVVLFFAPRDHAAWLRLAIARDIDERAWSPGDAEAENLRKFATVSAFRESVATRPQTIEVLVDVVTWRFALGGCGTCGPEFGDGLRQPPVAELVCRAL